MITYTIEQQIESDTEKYANYYLNVYQSPITENSILAERDKEAKRIQQSFVTSIKQSSINNNEIGVYMTQSTFESYMDTKSPQERKQYVDEQIALGNPKYKDRNTWLKENADKIRISKLEAQVNEILAKLPK